MKTYKIKQSDYDKLAKFPQLKKLADQFIAAGVLIIRDAAPAPTPEPPPQPIPGPAAPWQDRIKRPMLFFGSPCFFFFAVKDVRGWMEAILASGLTGPDIELNGDFPVIEYNGQRKKPFDVEKEYAKTFAAFGLWITEARRLGLVISVKFLNANQTDANRMPDSWWKAKAKEFVQRFGIDNMLILPLNEDDPRTRPSLGNAIRAGLIEAGFPKSRLIGWKVKGDNGYSETHPQKTDASDLKAGNYTHLNVSDSGQAIAYLYGSKWREGGTPNVANIKTYIGRIKKAGTSGGIFSFARTPDYVGLKASSEAWGQAGASPKPDEPVSFLPDAIDAAAIQIIGKNQIDIRKAFPIKHTLSGARIEGGNVRYIGLALPSSWWQDRSNALKGPRLHVYWQQGASYRGGHYEWTHHPGQEVKTLKNITSGYLGERPAPGSELYFCTISHDGKQRTPIVKASGTWK